MIEKQREKEFLFELERLYYNYNIVIGSPNGFEMIDLGKANIGNMTKITRRVESAIDDLRRETLEDVR